MTSLILKIIYIISIVVLASLVACYSDLSGIFLFFLGLAFYLAVLRADRLGRFNIIDPQIMDDNFGPCGYLNRHITRDEKPILFGIKLVYYRAFALILILTSAVKVADFLIVGNPPRLIDASYSSPNGSSCSLSSPDLDLSPFIARADIFFEGEVIGQGESFSDSPDIPTYSRFLVKQSFGSALPREITVRTGTPSEFKKGKRYLVFAYESSRSFSFSSPYIKKMFSVSFCSGSRLYDEKYSEYFIDKEIYPVPPPANPPFQSVWPLSFKKH